MHPSEIHGRQAFAGWSSARRVPASSPFSTVPAVRTPRAGVGGRISSQWPVSPSASRSARGVSKQFYGPALALGSAEVSPEELVVVSGARQSVACGRLCAWTTDGSPGAGNRSRRQRHRACSRPRRFGSLPTVLSDRHEPPRATFRPGERRSSDARLDGRQDGTSSDDARQLAHRLPGKKAAAARSACGSANASGESTHDVSGLAHRAAWSRRARAS